MQKIVEELKQVVNFKTTTEPGDIVLIAAKEPQMLLYAHVSKVERDSNRKDEWWHVQMDVLSIPLQSISWTLRTEQMTGQEVFTMGGEERFLAAVQFQVPDPTPSTEKSKAKISPLKRIK